MWRHIDGTNVIEIVRSWKSVGGTAIILYRGEVWEAWWREKNSYKALGRIVHNAELESLLVLEGFGESAAESIGRENLFTAELELGEDALNTQTYKTLGKKYTFEC